MGPLDVFQDKMSPDYQSFPKSISASAARLQKHHSLASRLRPGELRFAAAIAAEHGFIRLYRSRGRIVISRKAMWSDYREPFVVRDIKRTLPRKETK